jgi:hypothetical protein
MSNKLNTLTALSLASVFLLTGSLVNADTADKPGDLNNFLCKDIMRMSGTDRTTSLAAFHGYMLGKKNTTKYELSELANVSDKVIEYCLDNPDTKALDAFIKFSQ